tara:strand:- start:424 stop:1392 length:969 start_codon:yes stop_codon:yes gene_type:complete
MRLTLLLASLASAAAFTVSPHRALALPAHKQQQSASTTTAAAALSSIRMAAEEDKSPLAVLSALPWSNILQVVITLDCANRLTTGLPALLGPSHENLFGTALDVAFVGYGVSELLKQAGVGKTDYYAELEGADVGSFAFEAGEFALRGEVPTLVRVGDARPGRYHEVATFAGGCFWGTELHFQRVPGVVATCVGYTQGGVERPSYEQVCSGTTGHTEGLQLSFNPAVVSYEALCDKLLAVLGPDVTALNQVGNDRGTQYRHGIYPHTDAQAEAAARAIARCQAGSTGEVVLTGKVVTEVKPAAVFWPAEGYHREPPHRSQTP